MKPDSPTPIEPDAWDICPPGLLQETAKVTPPPNNGTAWWIATILSLGFLVGGGVAWTNLSQPAPEPVIEKVTVNCQFTQENMVAFISNEIDCETHKRMACHIMHCKCCCKSYQCLKAKLKKEFLLKAPATNAP